MGIKYPNIKECLSRTFPPEPTCCYFKPSIIRCVGSAEGERFATEWLGVRFKGDVMANFREEIGQEVMHLVVPNDGEFPCGAGKGMADGEGGAARTFCWQVRGCPVVMQAESISESTVMESKAMFV